MSFVDAVAPFQPWELAVRDHLRAETANRTTRRGTGAMVGGTGRVLRSIASNSPQSTNADPSSAGPAGTEQNRVGLGRGGAGPNHPVDPGSIQGLVSGGAGSMWGRCGGRFRDDAGAHPWASSSKRPALRNLGPSSRVPRAARTKNSGLFLLVFVLNKIMMS